MAIKLKRDAKEIKPTTGRRWGEFAEAVVAEFGEMRIGESFTVPCKGQAKSFSMRQVLNRLKKTKSIANYRSRYSPAFKEMRIWKI